MPKVSGGFLSACFFTGCGTGAILNDIYRRYAPEKKPSHEFSYFEEGPNKKRGNAILKYGVPTEAPTVSYYKNHALHYDQAKKIPSWVAEHLTDWNIIGEANRRQSQFTPDAEYPRMYQAQNSDFLHSGWSRGHMAPAGNNKIDQQAMNETFFLTNIVPQNIDNNAGFWNRFELYCRDLTKKYKDVRIISGPVMLPTGEETVTVKKEGKDTSIKQKYVKYPVIGDSEIAVPTHLYKLIIAESSDKGPIDVAAFIVPNNKIPRGHQLTQYQVPVEKLEEKTGFQLAPQLDKTKARNLCQVEGCKMMPFEQFELYYIRRKMEGAKTLNRLEKAWGEIFSKKLKPTPELENLYNKKKAELQESRES